jgi:hypothetical protein
MNKNNKIFLLLILGFVITLLLIPSFYLLNIKEQPDEKLFFQGAITPGKQFALVYTHSVAQTPVWEFFEMNKDSQLMLTETHFYDHGAGLPYAAFGDEVFVQEDGKFKIKNMSREISLPLYIRIGIDREDYFIFKNQEINLSEKLGDAVLTIDIAQINLFEYCLNNIFN